MNVNGGPLDFVSTIDDSQFRTEMRNMRNDISSLTNSLQTQGSQIESFAGKAAAAAAGFFSTQAAIGFVKSMVEVRGEFQQIGIAFTTMLGSKEKADQLMAEAVKLAAITPFTLKDVASGAKQLLAYGFGAQDVTKNLTMLGNVASGVGAQLGDLTYLYGTLKSQGRAYAVDIRQFAGRGIPIYEELAKVLKINKNQVLDYVSAGKVGFPQVEKAFQNMSGQGGKFFNLMQEQSKSLTGQLSNLSDAWDRMLNSLGQSQEGIIGDGIQAAIALVDNYQMVIDIIELLAITYGSYRAALLLTTAVTSGLTAVEIIEYGWLELKSKLTDVLIGKQAVLAASTAAYTAVIAALVAVGYSLIQYQDAAEIAEDSLTAAKEKGARAVDNETTKIDGLIKTIKDHNTSKREQKDAYDSLLETTKGALDSYSQEEIASGKAAGAIDTYKESIRKATEAQKEYSDYKGLEDQLKKIDDQGIKAISTFDKLALSFGGFFKALTAIAKGDFSGAVAEISKTFDKGIVQTEKDKLNNAKGKIVAANPEVQKLIDARNADRAADIATKKAEELATKTAEQLAKEAAAAKKYNSLLSNRVELERQITQDLAGARALGMDVEEEKIVSINKKYNDRIAQLDKINAKLKPQDQSKAKVQIEAARNIELGVNGVDAVINGKNGYKEELDKKQKMFADYEQAKNDLGEKLAAEMYKNQIGDYKSFADYIKADIESRKGDTTLLATKKNEVAAPISLEESNKAKKHYADLLKDFLSYQDKYQALNDKFEANKKEITDNSAVIGPEETTRALKILTESYQVDADALKSSLLDKSEAYQHLNEQVIGYTKQQLQAEVDAIEYTLKNTSGLSEKLKASLQQQLSDVKVRLSLGGGDSAFLADLKKKKAEIEEALKVGVKVDDGGKLTTEKLTTEEYKKQVKALAEINNEIKKSTAQKFQKVSSDLADISGAFGDLAGAVGESDAGLKDTLETMGQIAQVGSDAAGSVSSFLTGDIVGGITKGIKAITGAINIFKAAKESAKKAAAELLVYQDNLVKGELAYNQLLRERERTLVNIGDLSIAELKTQQALLGIQKSQASADYYSLLNRIKVSGQQITGEHTEKYGGFLGIGKKTRTVQELSGVAGMTYDQLEELYTKGKLTDSTKAWFEELKKAKDEMDDIGKSTQDAIDQINQIATGTIASSIADNIISGFKGGKRSAEEFADDFKGLMQDSFLSLLKDNYLNAAIADFYKEFAALSGDANGLTEDDVAVLRDAYNKAIQGGIDKLADFDKVTGGSTGADSTSSALQKNIKSITSQEANALEGLGRASYDKLKVLAELKAIGNNTAIQILNNSMQGLKWQQQTAENTFNSVIELKNAVVELKAINKNSAASYNLRGPGLG
jgi:hypothetical protein